MRGRRGRTRGPRRNTPPDESASSSAGLLAGSTPVNRLPRHGTRVPSGNGQRVAAYSCGGSSGFKTSRVFRPASLAPDSLLVAIRANQRTAAVSCLGPNLSNRRSSRRARATAMVARPTQARRFGSIPHPGRSLRYSRPPSTCSPVTRREPARSKAYSSERTPPGRTAAACRLAAVEIGPEGLCGETSERPSAIRMTSRSDPNPPTCLTSGMMTSAHAFS